MISLINEVRRIQQLAGIINESQLNEADTSVLGSMAKNLYSYLSKMKPNNPVDVNGNPLKNIEGDVITRDKKVKMSYQTPELAKKGKAKDLGKGIGGEEVTIYSTPDMVHALGFVEKEEAEAALKHMLDKYPNQFKGLYGNPEVYTNKMDFEWAKNHAPTYSFILVMKGDKEIAKSKSAKPTTQLAQTAKSLGEDTSVPSDVKNLAKAQQSASTVKGRAKNIDKITEFEGAFEAWFDTLGLEAGKGGATKMAIKNTVDRVLTKKGFK
jgi:hypothetical protein